MMVFFQPGSSFSTSSSSSSSLTLSLSLSLHEPTVEHVRVRGRDHHKRFSRGKMVNKGFDSMWESGNKEIVQGFKAA